MGPTPHRARGGEASEPARAEGEDEGAREESRAASRAEAVGDAGAAARSEPSKAASRPLTGPVEGPDKTLPLYGLVPVAGDDPAQLDVDRWYPTLWFALGPFPLPEALRAEETEPSAQLAWADAVGGPEAEATLMPRNREERVQGHRWRPVPTKTWRSMPGLVHLEEAFAENGKGPNHYVAYAVCWVRLERPVRNAWLLAGSDDFMKVWIDGRRVHEYSERSRAAIADEDRVEGLDLAAGNHVLLVKVVDRVGDSGFFLRLAGREGAALLHEVLPRAKASADKPAATDGPEAEQDAAAEDDPDDTEDEEDDEQ